ncbi:hypothetical protein M3J09_007305 [Ascochyta lentis]
MSRRFVNVCCVYAGPPFRSWRGGFWSGKAAGNEMAMGRVIGRSQSFLQDSMSSDTVLNIEAGKTLHLVVKYSDPLMSILLSKAKSTRFCLCCQVPNLAEGEQCLL